MLTAVVSPRKSRDAFAQKYFASNPENTLGDKRYHESGSACGRPHAIRPACRMMLRIMSGKMKAWNGNMEYQ